MRRTVVVLATAILAMALYFANVAWWFETEILDTDTFVATTLEAMEDEATRDAAAAIIVDTLADEFPLLRLLDAALVGLFSDLLGRDVIEPLIVATATDVHSRIVEGDQSALIIDLDPYRGLLLAPLESLSRELAALVPDDWFRTVEVLEEGTLPDVSAYVRHTRTAAIAATLLSVGLAAVILAISKRWFSAFVAVGVAFMFAGGFSALLPLGARSTAAVFIEDGSSTALLTGVFNAFTEPLTTRSLMILGLGAVLSVAGLLGWLVDRDKRTSDPAPGW
jgi:hypothetical protein